MGVWKFLAEGKTVILKMHREPYEEDIEKYKDQCIDPLFWSFSDSTWEVKSPFSDEKLALYFPLKPEDQHPHLASTLGFIRAFHQIGFVMEYQGDAMNLTSYVDSMPSDWSWKQRILLLLQIAGGMKHLHRRLPHTNLKPSNVLIVKNNRVLLTDMGSSFLLKMQTEEVQHDACRWYSPESLNWSEGWCSPRKFSSLKASDVWSFGMLMYVLWQRRIPYKDLPSQLILEKIQKLELPLLEKGILPCSGFEFLYSLCLKPAKFRPSFDTIHKKLTDMLISLSTLPSKKRKSASSLN